MSDRVTIHIDVDATQAEAEIDAVKAQADAVTKQWKIDRAILIQQVREGFTLISQMWSTFRQGMALFGQQIDPFFGALVGMVLSTTSMLISSATVLTSTVIGAPLGVILLGVAIGFNILSLGKLVADKAATMGMFDNINQEISRMTSIGRGVTGGLF